MNNYTIFDFHRQFPDDFACLEWVKNWRWPNGIFCDTCKRVTKHYRVVRRMSYSCQFCGNHVHPMAGTIYEKTRTPLRVWFHATFLMASTRCGISAKQLQRETGVSYKTAWRIFKQIRTLLIDDTGMLGPEVELDETYYGAKRKRGTPKGRPNPRTSHKTPIFGVMQLGGTVAALVTRDASRASVFPIIERKVLPKALVYTDEYAIYNKLGRRGYTHRRIAHSEQVYVMGSIHVNTIEGFWSLLKRGIAGVYHSVSAKYLQSYVNEYAFRYNHRKDERAMFETLMSRVATLARPDGIPS